MPGAIVVGVVIAAVVIIAWILFLPPFSVITGSSGSQSAGDGYTYKYVDKVPAPPAGLTPATRYIGVSLPKNGGSSISITLPLLDPKATNRGMAFYTYQSGSWQQLGPADVTPDGVYAQGQMQSLPNNLIVFKRASGALQVMGTLPAGKSLSPDAAKILTVLSPAGFAPADDGTVPGDEPPAVPGTQYDVLPVVDGTSGTNAATVNQLLGNPDRQSAHIAALTALANRPENHGIELDYTAVDVQQRQAFTTFANTLSQNLHKNQRTLVLELPAPTPNASGWNTGAYDWTQLAKAADYLKLLPGPDQSVYRKQIPDVIKFLTGQAGVDPQKIILVTSANSEDKSDQGVQPLTRLAALSLASQINVANRDQAVAGGPVTLVAQNLDQGSGGSGLIWDSGTATVSFVYKVGEATHVVWIENHFSEAFKLQYVQLYHLGGLSVDDASNDPSLGDVWQAVSTFVSTGSPQLQQPNPQLLAPSWFVDDKPLDTGGQASVSWTAPPAPGDHKISLIVSDGVVRVINNASITLRAGPAAGATVAPGGVSAVSATPRPAPLTATPSPSLRLPAISPSTTTGR